MANRLERVADLTVIPGTPAKPEVPQMCVNVQVGTRKVVETVTLDQVVSPTFGEYIVLDELQPGTIDYTTVIQNYGATPPSEVFPDSNLYTVIRYVPVYEQRCSGGESFVPGTPTQVIEDAGPDWLSYARSQPLVNESGGFTLKMGSPAIVGLMEPVADGGYSLGVVDYGIYYDGAAVFPVVGGSVGSSLGAYTGELTVVLDRQSGRYSVSVGGSVIDTANVTQSAPAALVAFLHTDEAYVVDPSSFQYATLSASPVGTLPLASESVQQVGIQATAPLPLPGTAVALVDGEMLVLAEASLPLTSVEQDTVTAPTEAEATLAITGVATTASAEGGQVRGTPMELLAFDHPYASVELYPKAQQLTAASTGDAPVQAITRVSLGASKPVVSAYVIAGDVLTASLTAPAQLMRSSEGEYASIEVEAPDQIMGAVLTTGEPLTVAFTELVYTLGGYSPTRVAAIYLDFGTLTGTSDASLTVTVPGALDEVLSLSEDYTLTQLATALIESRVELFMAANPPGTMDTQYLVTAVSGALSRSTGLDFTQFVYGAGVTHGVRKDGLYRIGGYAGEEVVDGEVDFGETSFGTSAAKNVETAYVGMRTDGSVYLALTADGRERVYRVIQREPTMRARVGKGITARSWGVKLIITDMTRADLDDVELVVGSSRRWTK